MNKTALAFADDQNPSVNSISNLGPIHSVMAKKIQEKSLLSPIGVSIDGNVSTLFGQQAYRRAKGLCRQLAQDDPATILKAIATLPIADQTSLDYLRRRALKMLNIYKLKTLDNQ